MKKKKNDLKTEVLHIEEFEILHIFSDPERIEGRIAFDRNDISQKLIFTLMDITHQHGFGCSCPHFIDDYIMAFLIGTYLPTKKSLNKYLKRLCWCLFEVYDFAEDFNKQLDFSRLDLSMFSGIDLMDFYPERLAAVRDQHFKGSWKSFKKAMLSENKKEEADIITRCMKFEKVNKKDMGFVGHKLNNVVNMLIEADEDSEIN